MKSQRLERINEIFQFAVDLSSEQRSTYLAAACSGDDELRAEVESLLKAHQEAGSFIADTPSDVAAALLRNDKQHPSEVGQYKIERLLGSGGMGEVYLATDKLGRKVALKLLAHRYGAERRHVARFKQEAQTVLTLNHPNIVTLYDIGQVDSTYYIASELIEGENLRQRLDKAEIPFPEILEIGIQVANALVAAHEKGIVHRDIKPENVMIRSDGYVKVLDFGIAKLMEGQVTPTSDEAPTVMKVETDEGSVMGTAPYMSPEQARGLPVDSRTDIWSFGVLLYETITGQKPFWGDTTQDVLSAVLEREPVPMSRYCRTVPEALEWIVSKALRKVTASRYQTAAELLADLKDLRKRLEFEAEQERSSAPEKIAAAGMSATADGGTSTAAIPVSTSSAEYVFSNIKRHKLAVIIGLLVIAAGVVALAAYLHLPAPDVAIESIAVLPFQNASGNADVEYLSDGMTESLINSLSQLPKLSVKARSTVFRYKGKEVDQQKVAAELSVQAILNGRVVERGDDLTLYLSLVEARNGNQIWGEQYNRKLADLVSLQTEIARDVSRKLQARLSGAEEQKLAKKYTTNPEAYRLYLSGRYHLLKVNRSEVLTSIPYFQQAIDLDPSYALAYVGLADAYRSPIIEMPSAEVFPKAKAAAQKALEIDDTLADAHAELGFIIFWYDWDWNAAENQFKRALELDPNNADSHLFYAHMLSNTGRHAEALAEAKRALELDPVNLRTNSLEGLYLIQAGRPDEALARLQKTFELDPNYYQAHQFAVNAYIEKGMFAEATAEARKTRELSGSNNRPLALLGYALAKSGKPAEARGLLEELLRLSTERYVSLLDVAAIYNGLGERDEALAWMERAFQQRDVRLVFLKVDPKWNNLRADPRFQVLLRRVGFAP